MKGGWEGERKRSFIYWFALQLLLTARPGSGRSQEPGVPSKTPTWAIGIQTLETSAIFPAVLAEKAEQLGIDLVLIWNADVTSVSLTHCSKIPASRNHTDTISLTFVFLNPVRDIKIIDLWLRSMISALTMKTRILTWVIYFWRAMGRIPTGEIIPFRLFIAKNSVTVQSIKLI